MHVARSLAAPVALVAFLVPAVAGAQARPTSPKPSRTARIQKSDAAAGRVCLKPPVEVAAGAETATFSLLKCDGSPAPLAVDQLSVLARPSAAPKPKQPLESMAHLRGSELAPGIRRLDARLVQRVEAIVEHFRRSEQPTRIQLVSGYRPRSGRSFHASGRALDFRIEGVDNEALVAFCKTLPDTGCGYYPNSVFVHVDVRDPGTGHVTWIDASRPGETPRYVSAWPAPGPAAPQPAGAPSSVPPSDARPPAPTADPTLPTLPAEEDALSSDSTASRGARRRPHTYFF
jgi:hypothetical protein